MQAVTGFEVANGGEGNDPTAATWIPVDMSGGWVAAAGILAGLYARARTGAGQRVETSLLGAGMLLHGGVFLRDGEVVRGPALDADQTGYGPGYRLYRCAERHVAGGRGPRRRRVGRAALGRPRPAGDLRPAARRRGRRRRPRRRGRCSRRRSPRRPAAEWAARLPALGVLAEVVDDVDRDGFRRRILDDPVNRELGRAVAYETADWGGFEQIGPLLRCGPDVDGGPSLHLPGRRRAHGRGADRARLHRRRDRHPARQGHRPPGS